jgi:alkylhydroperoxidase family enzyme
VRRERRADAFRADRVREALPDKQVVELVGTIAGYNMVARFVVATGLDRE